ncbi:amidohydrolase family protein [Patescibacteria group bacterium]|nr:amidohydrolase family protein [Patescibacteria group bacterium]MBU1935139.1 amidohydrolase family protein [Patescibacteria group bacterium]
MEKWDLLSLLRQKITEKGGPVCCHAHFDKAYVITPETLEMTLDSMEVKWDLWKKIKEGYTHENLVQRMCISAENMIKQGSDIVRTNIDVDNTVGMMCVEAALEVKEKYKDKINIQICSQVLEGAMNPEAQQWIEKAAPYVDVLGGLPSRDRPNQGEHLDYIFEMAKKHGKTVDVHIDQNNDPDEKDTELLAKKVIEHGMQGKVNAIHCCSLSAQEDDYMMEVIKLIKEADMPVVVCPRSMIDGVQLRNKTAPVHNSLAPVPQLVEGGVSVALGVDNVHDYFCPFIDGDIFTELVFLLENCRYYDVEVLSDIATVNGRRILEAI